MHISAQRIRPISNQKTNVFKRQNKNRPRQITRLSNTPTVWISEALHNWRSAHMGVVTSYGNSSVRFYSAPDKKEGEADVEWDVIHHGFPGTSLEFYKLPPTLRTDRNVLLIDGPGHLLSEARPGFKFQIRDYALHIHEVFDILGLNTPSRAVHLTGHSVGALILMYYLMYVTKEGLNSPRIRSLNLLAALGQMVRPYRFKRETHWDVQATLSCIYPALTYKLNSGIKDMDRSYQVLFDDPTASEVQEYIAENNRFWLEGNQKSLRRKSSALVTGTTRTERRILRAGVKYPWQVLTELGYLSGRKTLAQVRKIVATQLKLTGAHINIVIPTEDDIYKPDAQRDFARVMEEDMGLPVDRHEVFSGHMVSVERPDGTLRGMGRSAA